MITVEFLQHINEEYPNDAMVRLYDFDQKDLKFFAGQVSELLEKKKTLNLGEPGFYNPLNCSLSLRLGEVDRGIRGQPENLTCELTEASYRDMLEIVRSYADRKELTGFQWLYNLDCDIDFLLSKNGRW